MAKTTGVLDARPQIAWAEVTQSGIDALTTQQINTYVQVRQRIAWLIHQVWWYPVATLMAEIVTAQAIAQFAITTAPSTAITDLEALEDSRIIVMKSCYGIDSGAPATTVWAPDRPLITDMATMPGGGLLCRPQQLYLAMHTSGAGAARSLQARIYYSVKELSGDESLELLEASAIDQ